MKLSYDPAKREATLKERGLDFDDAAEVFAGVVIDLPDARKDYSEERIRSVGFLSRSNGYGCMDATRRNASCILYEENK